MNTDHVFRDLWEWKESRGVVQDVGPVLQAHGRSPQQAALGSRLQQPRTPRRLKGPRARQGLQTLQGLQPAMRAGRWARSAAAGAARWTGAPR